MVNAKGAIEEEGKKACVSISVFSICIYNKVSLKLELENIFL